MIFPLPLSSVSLWLAVATFVLLFTSEMITWLPEYAPRILINKARLRYIGEACGVAFLVTVVLLVI